MFLQKTLRKRVEVKGVGLHTGKPCSILLRPAPVGTGHHFIRPDLDGIPSLEVTISSVKQTQLATTLADSDFSVATIEHFMSAVAGFGIDNLYIEISGPEVPILDGSAKGFCEAISNVGTIEQDEPRRYLYVTSPISCQDDEKSAKLLPYNGFRITCVIDFNHPVIGLQELDLEISHNTYVKELAPARTFGFLKDVENLKSQGLILGGGLDNAIVLDGQKILNREGLRFPDEFVRHKMMDAIGDLMTLGHPILGHVKLYKAGHDLMNQFVKKIMNSQNCYNYVDLGASHISLSNSFSW